MLQVNVREQNSQGKNISMKKSFQESHTSQMNCVG